MACKRLKVTQICAENAENTDSVLFRGVINPYVSGSLSDGDKRHEKQHSHVDRKGGTNPRWDHTFFFTVDEAAARAGLLTLKFKIKAEKTGRSHREVVVGSVKVPVKKLLDQPGGDGMPEVATYGVWSPSGDEIKGVLKFSYEFGVLEAERLPPPADGAARRRPLPPMAPPAELPPPPRVSPAELPPPPRVSPAQLPPPPRAPPTERPPPPMAPPAERPPPPMHRAAPYSPPQGFPPQGYYPPHPLQGYAPHHPQVLGPPPQFYYPPQGYAPHHLQGHGPPHAPPPQVYYPPQGCAPPPQVYYPPQGYAPHHPQGHGPPPRYYLNVAPALQPQQLPPGVSVLPVISAVLNMVDTAQGMLEGFGSGAAPDMQN